MKKKKKHFFAYYTLSSEILILKYRLGGASRVTNVISVRKRLQVLIYAGLTLDYVLS